MRRRLLTLEFLGRPRTPVGAAGVPDQQRQTFTSIWQTSSHTGYSRLGIRGRAGRERAENGFGMSLAETRAVMIVRIT